MANAKRCFIAKVTLAGPLDERRTPRHRLILRGEAENPDASPADVIVHNLSADGILLQCDAPMTIGSRISIELPAIGTVEAHVRRVDGTFVGAAFQTRLAPASVGAVRAAAPVVWLRDSSSFENRSATSSVPDSAEAGDDRLPLRLRFLVILGSSLLLWALIAAAIGAVL